MSSQVIPTTKHRTDEDKLIIFTKKKRKNKNNRKTILPCRTLWSYQPRKETWREKFLKNYSVSWSRSILSIINWPLSTSHINIGIL